MKKTFYSSLYSLSESSICNSTDLFCAYQISQKCMCWDSGPVGVGKSRFRSCGSWKVQVQVLLGLTSPGSGPAGVDKSSFRSCWAWQVQVQVLVGLTSPGSGSGPVEVGKSRFRFRCCWGRQVQVQVLLRSASLGSSPVVVGNAKVQVLNVIRIITIVAKILTHFV